MQARSTEFDQFWDDSDNATLLDNIKNVFSHDLPRKPVKTTGFFDANPAVEQADYEDHKATMLKKLRDPKLELSKYYYTLCALYVSRNRIFKEPEGEYSRKMQYVMRKIESAQPDLKQEGKNVMEQIDRMEKMAEANACFNGVSLDAARLDRLNNRHRQDNQIDNWYRPGM